MKLRNPLTWTALVLLIALEALAVLLALATPVMPANLKVSGTAPVTEVYCDGSPAIALKDTVVFVQLIAIDWARPGSLIYQQFRLAPGTPFLLSRTVAPGTFMVICRTLRQTWHGAIFSCPPNTTLVVVATP